MSEDWKNDRAEASMREEETKKTALAAEEFKKSHPKVITIVEMDDMIGKWESEAGESFCDNFMHDNVADNSWAFWLLGKGFTEIANEIILEILSGNQCIEQELLYEIYNTYDGETWIQENYNENMLLWAEFLVSTPFYLEKTLNFFKDEDND
tara:strand:+ start:2078 stop:2533 length:456 start_codon:yes stop_codon:yes gene_type:complete